MHEAAFVRGIMGWRKISTKVRNGHAGCSLRKHCDVNSPCTAWEAETSRGWAAGGEVGVDHTQGHTAGWQLAARTEIQVLKLPQFRVPHATFQSLEE